jgi:hypothetical protein
MTLKSAERGTAARHTLMVFDYWVPRRYRFFYLSDSSFQRQLESL